MQIEPFMYIYVFTFIDADGNLLNDTDVPNVQVCLNIPNGTEFDPNRDPQFKSPYNYTWTNSKINFDNVGSAYLALFQVVSSSLIQQYIGELELNLDNLTKKTGKLIIIA